MSRSSAVKIATTEAEKEEIFRLRYNVYIEEMGGGRRHTEADGSKRQLRDDLDAHAVHFYAKQNDEVVGCVRTNLRRDGPLECEEFFQMQHLTGAYPDHVSMTSRLALHPKVRGSHLLMQLACAVIQHHYENEIHYDFLDCHVRLLPLYSRLGYRLYRPGFRHPKYTYVIPMVLVGGDLDHLERIKSPFLPIARRYPATTEWRDLLLNKFPAAAHTFVSADADETAFWDMLRANLLHSDTVEQCDLLADLTEDETKVLVSLGQIVSVHAGDPVLNVGDSGREIFLILDGSFQALGESGNADLVDTMVVNILVPGETFGEMSYFTEGVRCSSILAMESSNLLVLNSKALDKMVAGEPRLAAKLFRNLARIVETRFRLATTV
jgi:hypothetical protein